MTWLMGLFPDYVILFTAAKDTFRLGLPPDVGQVGEQASSL